MNDQQQIRADALTEAERLLLARVNDCTKPIDAADRNGILKLIDRLAASQSSQPAAAPIDTPTDREFALSAAICVHPKGVYGDEGGSMCCPITHTRDASFAPSPADERAAFEKVFPMPADCQRIGSGPTAGYAPTEYGAWEAHDFIRRWEGWKARAAASPAAEAVPAGWKLVPIEPTEEMSAAGGRFLSIMSLPEREAGSVYRAMLAAAPQPAQADAPAEAREPAKVDTKARMDWAAGILRKLPPLDPTYSIISILDDHDPEDRDEVLHSIRVFADMRATQALFTLYRAPADSGEARLTDEPSLTNPLTPYGMLVRALRIVSGTTLMDMAKALLTTPAKLSAMEFGRAPVTPEFAFDVAAYFDALGVPCTEYALRAAARAQGGDHDQ
ncbi:helix-turn-helix domain-containing protein [Burkholderia multivorans]|uniref:helix-turn-helix domain-containing protein n=1 Tax=Burkholderia multivorans TaxID=87883 RepID=UPI001C22D69C|nr:helix-turn-helix transcriptional regulator [Burkholderia multivorans]MBU9242650.1 helix-turn-helix domain-containing protein [Burkholderia multivorans]